MPICSRTVVSVSHCIFGIFFKQISCYFFEIETLAATGGLKPFCTPGEKFLSRFLSAPSPKRIFNKCLRRWVFRTKSSSFSTSSNSQPMVKCQSGVINPSISDVSCPSRLWQRRPDRFFNLVDARSWTQGHRKCVMRRIVIFQEPLETFFGPQIMTTPDYEIQLQ